MKRYALVIGVLAVLVAAGAATAQQVEIRAPFKAPVAPPPPPIDGIINPGLQYEVTQPDDARYLPPGPRVHHDPAFIEPLSVERSSLTETGRMGAAGWTSPTAAMGGQQSGAREITGYFAIGFAFEWGGPPQKARPR
jgi:hypothetical protein